MFFLILFSMSIKVKSKSTSDLPKIVQNDGLAKCGNASFHNLQQMENSRLDKTCSTTTSFTSAYSNFLVPNPQKMRPNPLPPMPQYLFQTKVGTIPSPFPPDYAAGQRSRLSTDSGISLGHKQTKLLFQYPTTKQREEYGGGQSRHNSGNLEWQRNYLTVPSFFVVPPTPAAGPTPSSIYGSTLSLDQRSLKQKYMSHRGELTAAEKYRYSLSRAQLKASCRTSSLLSAFAVTALIELTYVSTTPHYLLIILAVVTTLLVSIHMLTLLISTCLLPYIEANGCTKDSPHVKLKFYVEMSWLISNCIGLILFMLEICIIFFVKFEAIGFDNAAWITLSILIPVVALILLVSFLIRRAVFAHFEERMKEKIAGGALEGPQIDGQMDGRNQQQKGP